MDTFNYPFIISRANNFQAVWSEALKATRSRVLKLRAWHSPILTAQDDQSEVSNYMSAKTNQKRVSNQQISKCQ